MRPVVVVVIPEGLDQLPGVLEVDKLVFVEALVADPVVEILDVAILGRPAWVGEAMVDQMIVSPAFHGQTGKLGPIVGEQAARPASQASHANQDSGHSRTGQGDVGCDP